MRLTLFILQKKGIVNSLGIKNKYRKKKIPPPQETVAHKCVISL